MSCMPCLDIGSLSSPYLLRCMGRVGLQPRYILSSPGWCWGIVFISLEPGLCAGVFWLSDGGCEDLARCEMSSNVLVYTFLSWNNQSKLFFFCTFMMNQLSKNFSIMLQTSSSQCLSLKRRIRSTQALKITLYYLQHSIFLLGHRECWHAGIVPSSDELQSWVDEIWHYSSELSS